MHLVSLFLGMGHRAVQKAWGLSGEDSGVLRSGPMKITLLVEFSCPESIFPPKVDDPIRPHITP
jgi:hypothetical protein